MDALDGAACGEGVIRIAAAGFDGGEGEDGAEPFAAGEHAVTHGAVEGGGLGLGGGEEGIERAVDFRPAGLDVGVDFHGRLEEFGDLDGVERGTFEELVADDPEGESVVQGAVHAKAADLAIVLSGDVEGEGVGIGFGIIEDVQSGSLGQHDAGGFHGDGAGEFRLDGNAVGAEDGDAHAGHGGAEGGMVHDFAPLVFQLHFLLGVAGG